MCHIFYVFRDVGASMLTLFLVIGTIVGVGIAGVCALRYGLLNVNKLMHCVMATDELPEGTRVNEDLFETLELGSMGGNSQNGGRETSFSDIPLNASANVDECLDDGPSNPDDRVVNSEENLGDGYDTGSRNVAGPNESSSPRSTRPDTSRPSPKKYPAPPPPRPYSTRSTDADREFDLCGYCLYKQFHGKARNKTEKCSCVRRVEA